MFQLDPYPAKVNHGTTKKPIYDGEWQLAVAIVGALNGISECTFQMRSSSKPLSSDEFERLVFAGDKAIANFITGVQLHPCREGEPLDASHITQNKAIIWHSYDEQTRTFSIRVPCLELGRAAVLDDRDQHRVVPVQTSMPVQAWLEQVSRVRCEDVLPTDPSKAAVLPSSVYIDPLDATIVDEPVGQNKALEGVNREFKQVFPCMINQDALVLKTSRNLTHALLISQSAGLLIGVTDSGICIGTGISDLDVPKFCNEVNRSLSDVFPRFPASSLSLTVRSLTGTLPRHWNEPLIAKMTVKLVPKPLPARADRLDTMRGRISSAANSILVALGGRAYVEFDLPDFDMEAIVYCPVATADVTSLPSMSSASNADTVLSIWSVLSGEESDSLRRLGENQARYLIQIAVSSRLSPTFPRVCSVFRSKRPKLDNDSVYVPVHNSQLTTTAPFTVSMSPISMWLRLTAVPVASSFDRLLTYLRYGQVTCATILVGHDLDAINEDCVKHTLSHRLSCMVHFVVSYPASVDINKIDRCFPLAEITPRMWVVVYSAAAIDVLAKLIALDPCRNSTKTRNRILLLLHPKWLLVPDLEQQLITSLAKLGSHNGQQTELVGVMLLDLTYPDYLLMPTASSSMPIMNESSVASGLKSPSFPRTERVFFLREPESRLREQFQHWVRRSADVPLPLWDFISEGFIAQTSVTTQLKNGFLQSLELASTCTVVTLLKSAPGSGMTTTLRVAAYQCHLDNVFVLCLTDFKPGADVTKLIRTELCSAVDSQTNPQRLLIIADDDSEIGTNEVNSLQCLAEELNMSICLAVVGHVELSTGSIMKAATGKSFPVCPWLFPEDIEPVCHALCRGLKELVADADDEQSVNSKDQCRRDALSAAKNRALTSSSMYDRHIFIFCLTATNGRYQPAADFVRDIYQAIIKTNLQDVIDLVHLLAFVSAFSNSSTASWIQLSSLMSSLLDLPEFVQLFEENPRKAYQELPSYRCVHPFLARLYLTASCGLRWHHADRVKEPPIVIDKAWLVALNASEMISAKLWHPIIKALLVDRRQFVHGKCKFSALIQRCLCEDENLAETNPQITLCDCITALKILPWRFHHYWNDDVALAKAVKMSPDQVKSEVSRKRCDSSSSTSVYSSSVSSTSCSLSSNQSNTQSANACEPMSFQQQEWWLVLPDDVDLFRSIS